MDRAGESRLLEVAPLAIPALALRRDEVPRCVPTASPRRHKAAGRHAEQQGKKRGSTGKNMIPGEEVQRLLALVKEAS